MGVPQVAALEVPVYDMAWAEGKMKKAALKLEKLDTDLKNYKANSIKESIRRGHDDLGDHYLDLGDLSNALKCYSRARDYCTRLLQRPQAHHHHVPQCDQGKRLPAELVARPELRQQSGIDAGFRRIFLFGQRRRPSAGHSPAVRCRISGIGHQEIQIGRPTLPSGRAGTF